MNLENSKVEFEGETWYMVEDICEFFGVTDELEVLELVDILYTKESVYIKDSFNDRSRPAYIVNEKGMYTLILELLLDFMNRNNFFEN
jgi:prophage antirepressor-like protein